MTCQFKFNLDQYCINLYENAHTALSPCPISNEINIHNVKLWYQHTKIYYNITKLKTKIRLVDILTSAVVILNMIPSCIPNLVKLLTHSHAYFQSTKCYYTQLKSFYFDIWKEINQYKFNTVLHESKKPNITWAVQWYSCQE